MKDLYSTALTEMTNYFERLSDLIDAPRLVKFEDGYVYRYENPSILAAILQKLSRVVTGLQAMHLLNFYGFLQEQAAMQRILDELTEDISFLTYAVIFDRFTDLHEKYLDAFYKEEFDQGKSAIDSSQKRPMISRRKIRAYINNVGDDPSTGIEVSRTLSKTYSSYLHGASPQIMELYYGNPPKFHLRGAQLSPFYQDHVDEMLNYFYRGIMAFGLAAKSFGDIDLFDEIYAYTKGFAVKSSMPE